MLRNDHAEIFMPINVSVRRVAIRAFLLPVLFAAGCAWMQPSEPQDLRTMIHQAQEKMFPSVVFIKPIRQHLATGEKVRQQIFGSGVIISPDGLTVTNSHVAMDTTEIKCVLFTSEQLPAKLVGLDQDTDLALIQIQLPPGHAPLPAAEFGDSDVLQPGQFVMAFGSPLGFTRSISLGIVSSPRRYLEIGPFSLWIQTDAAINPGNSGGPLVDDHGKVIGINTLRVSMGENIGFAIPSNTVQRIIGEIRQKGEVVRAYSGVQLQPLKDFLHDTILDYNEGVLVAGVDERSPAAAAGLKAGDLILNVNDTAVNGVYLEDLPAVRLVFGSLTPDAPAQLRVRRGQDILMLTITPIRKQQLNTEGLELPVWNCSVQEISKFRTPVLAYFSPRGIYVLGVRNPGNAQASGLRPGDIILTINGEPILTPEHIMATYQRLSKLDRGQRTALIEVLRNGYRQFIVLDFNRDYKQITD
jgi:serine protease Do